jgi:hypothetical protein
MDSTTSNGMISIHESNFVGVASPLENRHIDAGN